MDQTTKKQLLIFILVVIALLFLFGPSFKCSNNADIKNVENYTASFDPAYVDIPVNPYSADITYTPVADVQPNMTPHPPLTDDSFTKLYDYLDDEKVPPVVTQKMQSLDAINQHRGKPVDCKLRTREDVDYERNVNIETSYQDTQLNPDRVTESNNIVNYCIHKNKPDDEKYYFNNNFNANGVDEHCAAVINGPLDMAVDDQTFYDMRTSNILYPTDLASAYNSSNNKGVQDISGLKEITEVMNEYRDRTLDTIQGSYRDSSAFCNMYNRVN
jgi:hypothetical protein